MDAMCPAHASCSRDCLRTLCLASSFKTSTTLMAKFSYLVHLCLLCPHARPEHCVYGLWVSHISLTRGAACALLPQAHIHTCISIFILTSDPCIRANACPQGLFLAAGTFTTKMGLFGDPDKVARLKNSSAAAKAKPPKIDPREQAKFKKRFVSADAASRTPVQPQAWLNLLRSEWSDQGRPLFGWVCVPVKLKGKALANKSSA